MRTIIVLLVFGLVEVCRSQNTRPGDEKGLLNRRPIVHSVQSSPCWSGDSGYDSVDEDLRGRHYLLAAGAGAVGGAALGYHLGMKHQNQPIINNNIYNEIPAPCVVVQGGGGGGGSWAGSGSGTGGGGLVSGILSHHPILSNILQGGLLNGGGLLGNGGGLLGNGGGGGVGNRQDINWNRAIRQFNRAIRPLTRF